MEHFFKADEFVLSLPEDGFGNLDDGEYTYGQGNRNGYNLIDRSSVSCNFCGISKAVFWFWQIWKIFFVNSLNLSTNLSLVHSATLLTAENIWFKCDLYLQFIPTINLWKVCIDLRPFSKCFRLPFWRTLRSPRSNNLEIQNYKNYKWKLVKTRWNPKFGLSDLKNDLLTSMTSEGAWWIFSKITFLKSVDQAEKNEL